MSEFNVGDPLGLGWGGPKESKVDFRMVDALLSTADSGCDVLRQMPSNAKHRNVRLEKVWSLVERAEGMLLRELSRRIKRSKERAKENDALEDIEFSDVDDDEEDAEQHEQEDDRR